MGMVEDKMDAVVDNVMRKVEEEDDLLVPVDSKMVDVGHFDNESDGKGNDEMVVVEDDFGMNDDYDGVDDVNVDDDNNEKEEEVVVERDYSLMD